MDKRIKEFRQAMSVQQGDFASSLGVLQQQLSKYERGENKPSVDFLIKLVEKYNVNLNWLLTGQGRMFENVDFNDTDAKGTVEIPYCEFLFKQQRQNFFFRTIHINRKLVHDIWKKDEAYLRVVNMPGDSMQGGEMSIKDDDILLIDSSMRNPSHAGIYAYSTMDKFFFVNGIKRETDGRIKFYHSNKSYEDIYYTQEQLDELQFKILGRVVKNISFCFN